MKHKKDFFWVSYSDLMTSLFFIMFVLFIVAQLNWEKEQENLRMEQEKLKIEQEKLKMQVEQQKKLTEIERLTKSIDKNIFRYDEKYKRFELKRQINFDRGVAKFKYPEDESYLISAGVKINNFLNTLKSTYKDSVKYVVLIEGMSSRDNRYFKTNCQQETIEVYYWRGYKNERKKLKNIPCSSLQPIWEQGDFILSYERALAVKRLWDENNISLNPDICEFQIAGSGIYGVGRDPTDESKNQRILIQIIPKIGSEELTPGNKK